MFPAQHVAAESHMNILSVTVTLRLLCSMVANGDRSFISGMSQAGHQGVPTIETEEASVDWTLLLSAGSHMVTL